MMEISAATTHLEPVFSYQHHTPNQIITREKKHHTS
jgi:hypothetical protein